MPPLGWLQIIVYRSYCEAFGLGFNFIGSERVPCDVGWKTPLLSGLDGEAKTKKLSAEAASGKLTMVAISGMFLQDGIIGSAWGGGAD